MEKSAFLASIIDIAIGIEKEGAQFYTRASNITKSESTRGVLSELAGIEKEHGRSFSTLKDALRNDGDAMLSGDPDKTALRYLASWSDEVRDKIASTYSELDGNESDEDMLRIALSLEKDSIAYYAGMCTVLEGEYRLTVDRIVREEMDHYTTLQKTLSTINALKAKG